MVGFAAAGPNTRTCQLCLFLGAGAGLQEALLLKVSPVKTP